MSPTAPGLGTTRPAPAARKAEVSRALATIAGQVAQLPEPYVRALQPVLLQAQAELARDLKAWLARAPDGEERFTAQHLRNALLQTRAALEHMEKRVPIGVEGTLRAMGATSGSLATQHLHEEVAVFAGVFGHSVRPIQIQQAAIIAEGREQLIPRWRNSARRYGKDIATDIRHQMALGVARGETFAQLTDRLQRHGGPRGLVSLAGVLGEPGAKSEYIAEGLFAKYRGWAARVVRTEGNHAYNAHALIGLDQMEADDPGYQKRWDATSDRVCPICKVLDGEIADLDKPFSCGVMHPPIHPNDRCGTTPWRPEWAKAPVAPPQPPVESPPPDVEAEKRRAAEEAARKAAEKERAAAAKREAEDDRRDQERRDALRREAEERAARQKAIEEESRRREAAVKEAAAKAERERLAAAAAKVAAPPPVAGGQWRRTDLEQKILDGDWNGARDVITRDLAKQGYVYGRRGAGENREVLVKEQRPGVAGTNWPDGHVELAPSTAARAQKAIRDWEALTEADRAKVRQWSPESHVASRDRVMEILKELDAVPPGKKHDAAREEVKKRWAAARAEFALQGKSQEVVDGLHSVKTLIHEDLHSHGRLDTAQYRGTSTLIEEVATETAARLEMARRYGFAPEKMRSEGVAGGSYSTEIYGTVKAVQEELRLSFSEAYGRVETASREWKSSSEHAHQPDLEFAKAMGGSHGLAERLRELGAKMLGSK